jgi:hypothetical protein
VVVVAELEGEAGPGHGACLGEALDRLVDAQPLEYPFRVHADIPSEESLQCPRSDVVPGRDLRDAGVRVQVLHAADHVADKIERGVLHVSAREESSLYLGDRCV